MTNYFIRGLCLLFLSRFFSFHIQIKDEGNNTVQVSVLFENFVQQNSEKRATEKIKKLSFLSVFASIYSTA